MALSIDNQWKKLELWTPTTSSTTKNQMNRLYNKFNTNKYFASHKLVLVEITGDERYATNALFNQQVYVFSVNESYLGLLGDVKTAAERRASFNFVLDPYLNDYFRLND